MKSILLFLFTFSYSVFSFTQTPNWLWAKASTGGGSEGWAICTDPFGSLYVTGSVFSAPNTFGSVTLNNAGVIVVKYDPSGNVLWAKCAGGSGNNLGRSISADASGNVYVTGDFEGSITFGSIILTSSAPGTEDFFLAKFDSSGNVLWAESAGGTNSDYGYSISTDADGNSYVTGSFQSSIITFGSITLNNSDITGSKSDIFFAKYDSSGNALWAKNAGGSNNFDWGYCVCTDAFGNAYVTGYFESDSIILGGFTLIGSGNLFIVKFDSFGNVLWAKSSSGGGQCIGFGITCDRMTHIYITGWFQYASVTFGGTTLTNSGGVDMFITKYDSSGNVIWAKSAIGNNSDWGYSVSTDTSGNVYVTGPVNSDTISFGPIAISPPPANCAPFNCDPMFIVKYDSSGNELCADALASGGDDWSGVSADNFGNVYVTGDFLSVPFVIGYDSLIKTGVENLFTAKFSCGIVSVNDINMDESIRIFPNPTKDIFTIQMEMSKINNVEVFNIFGERICQSIIGKTDKQSINLGLQPNGIYFLYVKTDQGIISKKVIINR